MKRLLAALMAAGLLLLSACGYITFAALNPATAPTPQPEAVQSAQPAPSAEPEEEFPLVIEDEQETPAPMETPEPTVEPEPTPEPQETEPVIEHQHTADLGIKVRYLGADTDVGCMLYQDGRLYISRSELELATGKADNGAGEYLPEIDGCISLADVANRYDLEIGINSGTGYIDMYDAAVQFEATGAKGTTEGYIRFEDVMASGIDKDGNPVADADFTDYNLEKFRVMGEYMESRGQKFYIAWIPLYVNPITGVSNNVIENQCLYNANFIFTLDYLRLHGGYIVLHGYSHQQCDTESSVGNEFGGDTPYSIDEMCSRMDSAIQMAKTLGYEHDIFEFPHYAHIESSRKLAEEKFDIIYQYASCANAQIETVDRDGKTVTYIPTPPDYVYSRYDTAIFDRLAYAHNNGQLMSLFYHPTIEFGYVGVRTEGNTRYGTIDLENSFMVRIINKIEAMGYVFGHYEH